MAKKWVSLLVLGLGLLLSLGLWLCLPKVEVVNQLSFKQFQLSTLGANLYLWRSGYWPQVKRVSITYTAEPQKGYGLKGSDGAEVLSMWMDNQQGHINVYIHYNQQTYADISAKQGWFDHDVYAGICLALESKSLGWQGCREKASRYYQWSQDNHLPSIIKKNKGLFGFELVKSVYAACYGTIICGKEEWTCSCSGGTSDNDPCTENIHCPGGYCNCDWGCNLDAGNDLACSSVDNYLVCKDAGVEKCAVGCNTDPDDGCVWLESPPPPESDVPPTADL
jgi:hypothetical protein